MSSSLILGIGNPLRSDDGLGSKAAAALAPELSSAELQVVAAHQLLPEMAEHVAHSVRVLFLDASHTGGPGEIRCEQIHRDPNFQPGNLSHQFSPAALLELAFRYFQAEPEAWLLTMAGANFDLGEAFSPPVKSSWNCYLERVKMWVSLV